MYLSKTRQVQLEEAYNLLLTEPRIQHLHRRARLWVNQRLSRRLKLRLSDKLRITQDQWQAFLLGQEPETAQKLLEHLQLSRERGRQYRRIKRSDPRAAAEWLAERLLEKEQKEFCAQIGISRHAWDRFLNCTACPSEHTVTAIIQGLSLAPSESREFMELVCRDTFAVTAQLKQAVRSKLTSTGMPVVRFLEHAELSENAWLPFGSNTKNLPTSQHTLLKLILGTEMDEAEGTRFLNTVNSDFILRRDLAVLICIRDGIFEKKEIYYILEYFAQGYGGERFFRNLYADPGLE